MTFSPLPPSRSLEEVHRSVPIPRTRWWRRWLAFAGPAYLVSVGYMDPGNWATDLEGGARFGYGLIWVLLMSNAMAVLLQTLSARLGLVTGHDLAQACRDEYPPVVRLVLFVLCEIAIAACDLAEVIGSAIGLHLLFGIPVLWAVLITASDVLILLAVQRFGMRKMEAVILSLIALIGICFVVELFLSKPSVPGILAGFVPRPLTHGSLYVAIGILGATVMPHNLYLHSALVQSRNVRRSREDVASACRFNLLDSVVAMNGAFFINAAILIVAAATFYEQGIVVTQIEQAHELLSRLLGSDVAPIAFAVALLAAGQSSTVTGTLAGQITMEGFLQFRMRPWLRRLITRSIAILPAVLVILYLGDEGIYHLLILSQVVLSLQLSFAVVPLVKFTSSKQKMGPFVNPTWLKILAWTVTAIIIALNAGLVVDQIADWIEAAGSWGWLVGLAAIPVTILLAVFLLWLTLRRERGAHLPHAHPDEIVAEAARYARRFRRIGVALEAVPGDAAMLAEAIALAKTHHAELVLIHVVEGAGGQWYGPQTGDQERQHDEAYLEGLTERLRKELVPESIPAVSAVLGYGDVPRQIAEISRQQDVDMMVLGSHGHWGPLDWLYGETIEAVRHRLRVPVLSVR